jgi:hypothetical protein
MDSAKSVAATFTINRYTLTVSRGGNGIGAVSSSPAGLDCGADCTVDYDHGTLVTLTPTPARRSVFISWEGACTGSGPCVVSMEGARSVTAIFDTPHLRIDDVTVTEGDTGTTSADFTVHLSPAASVPVTVDWATAEGSATAESDYTTASGTITFPPGSTSQTVSVAVLGDVEPEPFESFSVNLSNPIEAPIEDAQGRALIRNDDLSPGSFYTLPPCRVLDTRGPVGTYGGPPLAAGVDRVIALASRCDIPDTAKAISVNVAVTEPTDAGNLTFHPAGTPRPIASALNYSAGQTRSNNAILMLDDSQQIAVWCAQPSGTAHLILDVNGYFE